MLIEGKPLVYLKHTLKSAFEWDSFQIDASA